MCALASSLSLVQCCHYVMCMRVNIKKSQKEEVGTIEKRKLCLHWHFWHYSPRWCHPKKWMHIPASCTAANVITKSNTVWNLLHNRTARIGSLCAGVAVGCLISCKLCCVSFVFSLLHAHHYSIQFLESYRCGYVAFFSGNNVVMWVLIARLTVFCCVWCSGCALAFFCAECGRNLNMCALASSLSLAQWCHYVICMRGNIKKSHKKK